MFSQFVEDLGRYGVIKVSWRVVHLLVKGLVHKYTRLLLFTNKLK